MRRAWSWWRSSSARPAAWVINCCSSSRSSTWRARSPGPSFLGGSCSPCRASSARAKAPPRAPRGGGPRPALRGGGGAHAVNEGPAIVFDRVSKSFTRPDGEPFEAVRDLSFSIARGELVAILGKTGCGKSTTFNLIAGLLRPSQGRVLVDGHDPFVEFDWFRGKVGIVFQNDRLMPSRSAIDNVALGLELNKVARDEGLAVW